MAASYPTAVKSFSTKVDLVDSVLAAHVNDIQLEVSAIETELGTSPKRGNADVKTRLNAFDTGWIEISDTWTYASATTVTVPTNATTSYEKGYAVRFKQGGGYKYYYLTSLTATVLTLNGGSDYSVANSAITNIAVAPAGHGVDFPYSFNYAPTRAVSGGTVPTYTATDVTKFWMQGGVVWVQFTWINSAGGTAGAGANSIIFNLPVTATSTPYSNANSVLGFGHCYESAGTQTGIYISYNTTTTARFQATGALANIVGNDQSSTDRRLSGTFCYEAA